MNTYIEKLQSKKEETRKQILVTSLIVSMSLVVFVWVYSFGDTRPVEQTASAKEGTLKPFTLFANSISNTYNNISASIGKISSGSKTGTEPQKQIDLVVVDPDTK